MTPVVMSKARRTFSETENWSLEGLADMDSMRKKLSSVDTVLYKRLPTPDAFAECIVSDSLAGKKDQHSRKQKDVRPRNGKRSSKYPRQAGSRKKSDELAP